MKIVKFPFNSIPGFSKIQSDYIEENDRLFSQSINLPFNLDSFGEMIEKRGNIPLKQRKELKEIIEGQYAEIGISKDLSIIENSNSFTITTGHQLNILTGPAYYIYKIVSIINIAKQLKNKYPEKNFIPLFWLATEDHDFEEINHFNLFNKEYKWETDQKGAVGRFHLKGIETILNEINDLPELFKKAYSLKNMSEAIRYIVHQLFDQYGVVCLDADNKRAKQYLIPIIKKEIFERESQDLVNKSIQKFSDKGYEIKLYPREINFFYLKDNLRERIVEEAGQFSVLNMELKFSKEELEKEIEAYPERFSPNVIFRPIYQEALLPNLCYVGGPGEIAYWLSLKDSFDLHQVSYPILAPRNSIFYFNEKLNQKIEQLGKALEFYFSSENELKENYLNENSSADFEMQEELNQIEDIFSKILSKGMEIDKTMEGPVLGEKQRVMNSIQNLEKKLKKAEERKHEVAINQLLQIKNRFFPNGKWQERMENYLNFAINDANFIQNLVDHIDPFDSRVNFISPNNG